MHGTLWRVDASHDDAGICRLLAHEIRAVLLGIRRHMVEVRHPRIASLGVMPLLGYTALQWRRERERRGRTTSKIAKRAAGTPAKISCKLSGGHRPCANLAF